MLNILAEDYAKNMCILTAPTKTFNLGGIQIENIFYRRHRNSQEFYS